MTAPRDHEAPPAPTDADRRVNGASPRLANDGRDPLPAGVDRFEDLGNAYRLQRLHGRDLRYVRELGWLTWDGQRWAPDSTGEVHRRIHTVARAIEGYAAELALEASRVESETERDRLRSLSAAYAAWARKSQSERRIRAAAKVASTLEGIAITSAVLDTDDMLITCNSGTVDLRTGEQRGHRREDLITRLAPVDFDPEAEAPTWLAFLERVLPDAEVRAFVQRALGYSLTGATGEQCLFVMHGTGRNGKTTLVEAVRRVLGTYALHVQTDTLMCIGRGRGADNDLVRLRGARFVTAIETGEERRLDEPRIKALTGGDTIAARLLYREPIEFHPVAKIWLATNHRPTVTGTDTGIWRRLRLLPFNVEIQERECDPKLGAKLASEGAGIIAWMLQGCAEWQSGGLRPPEAVLAATAEWRADSDEVARFIGDRCKALEGARTRSSDLYAAYAEWARAEGNREPLSATAFGRRLTEAGHVERRSNGQRFRAGIGLLTEDSAG